MNNFNRLFIFVLAVFTSISAFSQEDNKINISTGLDVTSRYVWRGGLCSDAFNIQPEVNFEYGCFTLTGFGSYAASRDFAEFDLIASIELGNFTLELSDFFVEEGDNMWETSYFNWKRSSTLHLLETTLSYELPFEKFPLKLSSGVMLFGDDLNENDNQNYSTYFELLYPFTYKEYSLSAFVGGTGNSGSYADRAAVVNTGISLERPIAINSNYSLALNTSLIVNPDAGNIFLVVGITF